MKVTTSTRPFPFLLNLAFAIFCLGGGIWGAYDYWIAYPAIQRANDELADAKKVLSELASVIETRAKDATTAPTVVTAPSVSAEDIKRYEAAQETIRRITTEFNGEPRQLAAWDRPLQLWLWVIGCGLLGTPFFVWPLIRMKKRRWTLEENGTLLTPTGSIPLEQVAGIDMSRWCSPTGSKRSTWKAWLLTQDGARHELDDHDYKDMHLIIGFYAHRFHPDEWTSEAKRVKPLDSDVQDADGSSGPAGSDGLNAAAPGATAAAGSDGDD